jgi:hypothetical protein
MALKFRLESIDDLPEAVRAEYKETTLDGKTFYVLQVDGVVPNERAKELQDRLSKFRSNNTALADQVKAMAAAIGVQLPESASIDELTDLIKERQEEIEAEIRKTAGKTGKMTKEEMEALVADRVAAFKSQHETAMRKLQDDAKRVQEERDKLFGQLEKLSIENEVIAVAGKRGLRPTAHPDIVTRARTVFRFVDGKVRALLDDGETPVYGPDGLKEVTISEWVEQQASKDAPHLFESNSGGGASGGSGGAGRNGSSHVGANPWSKEKWNVTRQFELIKRDPATANRLAQEHGHTIPMIANR